MAENGSDNQEKPKVTVDKEERLRTLKQKQNEERQKKLEEIKTQALAAQRFKEQKEFERRKRLDELRVKEDVRRQQVEERKKAITEAERDRLESILRRNQEREARIEARKRNERSNIVFAFGSSTPRMLDPTDMAVSFWGHRKATSTQNIACSMSSSLTRRQAERELDVGSKKRATSAGGLERSSETSSRPSSSLSQQSTNSIASSVSIRHRPLTAPRRPRPFSIAVTGVTHDKMGADKVDQPKPPLPRQGKSISKPGEKIAKQSTIKQAAAKSLADEVSKNVVTSPTGPGVPIPQEKLEKTNEKADSKNKEDAPALQKQNTEVEVSNQLDVKHQQVTSTDKHKDASEEPSPVLEKKPPEVKEQPVVAPDKPVVAPEQTNPAVSAQQEIKAESAKAEPPTAEPPKAEPPKAEPPEAEPPAAEPPKAEPPKSEPPKSEPPKSEPSKSEPPKLESQQSEPCLDLNQKQIIKESAQQVEEDISTGPSDTLNEVDTNKDIDMASNSEMTTSMTKPRITTEEEAKAALAERRRLAREEAERQAEMERQRIEAEQRAELERQRQEEEQLRQLVELQRKAEEERLQEAIREAQKREEEERLRREEEQRLKALKEEAERKAREEAERQKAELQERLKNEEKEREARRKRVEAIMLRTRGKNNANLSSQQNSEDKNENKSENKKIEDNKVSDENKVNENKMNGTKQENGTGENTTNGKSLEIVDNMIRDDTVKNANTADIRTDSINSNNAWQSTQQYGNIICNNNS